MIKYQVDNAGKRRQDDMPYFTPLTSHLMRTSFCSCRRFSVSIGSRLGTRTENNVILNLSVYNETWAKWSVFSSRKLEFSRILHSNSNSTKICRIYEDVADNKLSSLREMPQRRSGDKSSRGPMMTKLAHANLRH